MAFEGVNLGAKSSDVDLGKKGNSIIELLDDYCCVDLETTGLSYKYDKIIEVGAVRVRSGQITDRFTSLVHVDYLDSFITQLTGITIEMLANAPSVDKVLWELKEFVGNDVIVGHNVTFDIDFLCFGLAGLGNFFTNDYINTLRLSRRVLPSATVTNHKLSTLIEELHLGSNTFHRALGDAEATYKLYEYLKKQVKDGEIDILKNYKHAPKLNAKDISAATDEFDESHPLYGKVCVFTGTLSVPRKDAMQMVANVGGINANGINKQTNYLIVGDLEYGAAIKDGKSSKLKKAEDYILSGQDITILDENAFASLLAESNSGLLLSSSKLPAEHLKYAREFKKLYEQNGISTDNLRFSVEADKLTVSNYYPLFTIIIGKKIYIKEKGSANMFISHFPNIEVKQLSKDFHIFIKRPENFEELKPYFIAKIKAVVDQLNEDLMYDFMIKRLKAYLSSSDYIKI